MKIRQPYDSLFVMIKIHIPGKMVLIWKWSLNHFVIEADVYTGAFTNGNI